jgi:TonB family protein
MKIFYSALIISLLIHAVVICVIIIIVRGHPVESLNYEHFVEVGVSGGTAHTGTGKKTGQRDEMDGLVPRDITQAVSATQTIGTGTNADSPAGAEGLLNNTGNGRVPNQYEADLIRRINENKYYPATARKQRLTGTVKLKFVLNRDGTLRGDISKVKTSGYDILDEAGIKTIESVAPFQPFPEYIKEEVMTFFVDIDYIL